MDRIERDNENENEDVEALDEALLLEEEGEEKEKREEGMTSDEQQQGTTEGDVKPFRTVRKAFAKRTGLRSFFGGVQQP